METLVAARKVGLPLMQAAEMAGVEPQLAHTWLTEGRKLMQLGRRRPLTDYRARCQRLAHEWDKAPAGLIGVLRGFMLEHARRDPKACVQALTSFEREYHQRWRNRALPAEAPAELAEPFMPLDLAGVPAARAAKFTRTAPDGTVHEAEFRENPGGLDTEAEQRTDLEIEHYLSHGEWPAPPLPPRVDESEEDPGVLEVADEVLEELTQALSGGQEPAEQPSFPVEKGEVIRPSKPAPAPLRRVREPELVELGEAREAVITVVQPPPVKRGGPAHPPLRRVEVDR